MLALYLFYQQAEQKSVSVLDKKISDALSYVDEAVDAKKDETIEGIVSAKKAVGNLGPVKGTVVRKSEALPIVDADVRESCLLR